MDDVTGILGALHQESIEVFARMPPPARVQHDWRKLPIEAAGDDASGEDTGAFIRRPRLVLRLKCEDPSSGVVALEQRPVGGYRFQVAEDREHCIGHRLHPLELRGCGKRDSRPLLPLREAMMGHAQRIAHYRNDRIHAGMVLGAAGLSRQGCGERSLTAGTSQHLALENRGPDGRLCRELYILVRHAGVVELASTKRLGAPIACLEFRMFYRHALGRRVVINPVASVAFLLLRRVFPSPATLGRGLSCASEIATSDEVANGLEQDGKRILGKLSFRQAFFQSHQLRRIELHRRTPSFRRNSRSSGRTRQVFTGSSALLWRSIRPRPEVGPTSTQLAAR